MTRFGDPQTPRRGVTVPYTPVPYTPLPSADRPDDPVPRSANRTVQEVRKGVDT